MRLCQDCLMAYMDSYFLDHAITHTVRRLNFSDGFRWCERCVEGASREPARYFVMKLERIEAEKSV